MDVASVQSLLQPLLARIETLEHHNEELKERVKALEAAMHNERSYQKMTSTYKARLSFLCGSPEGQPTQQQR